MIKIYKRENAPTELAGKGYQCDEVKQAILEDQHNKCYLCERTLTTDYQVEHLASLIHHPRLKDEWSNLFVACNYCNDRKKSSYDDIPAPTSMLFEDIIKQSVCAIKQKAEFVLQDTQDSPTHTSTQRLVDLLEKLYNGKGRMRNLMEERFWKEFYDLYLNFMQHIANYIKTGTEESRQMIEADLTPDQPILGFKYAILKRNADLWKTFSYLCHWDGVYKL